jgi:hypothetical protein
MFNRRKFVLAGAPLLLAGRRSLAKVLTSQDTAPVAALRIHPEEALGTVPANMMGLSYESTQLGEPAIFSPDNHGLIALFKTLSPHGNLRLGGNTSEFTYFKATVSVPSPAWSPAPTQPDALTPITPLALHNLRGFLDATGWNCIYGLNLGTGTPERAAEEAEAVNRILGPKLDYLQIGNEPNNYIRYKLRPSTWDPEAFLDQWLDFARAIVRRSPQTKLGGPDCYPTREWVQVFSARAKAEMGEHLVALTDHYYAEGPPTSPKATMANLLHDTNVDDSISVMSEFGRITGLDCRMTEVNSCYQGGKPGVSDTLGSALWAANLTLRLLASGFCGVNFHGGSARQIKASLGGILPGDSVAKNLATDSYYTPIAGTATLGYRARPIFFGMQMVSQMANSTRIKASFAAKDCDLTAYAALDAASGMLKIAIFNMGGQARDLTIDPGRAVRPETTTWLCGPSVDSTVDIRLGDVQYQDSFGVPRIRGTLHQKDSRYLALEMPPTSAVVIHLHESQ